MSRLGRIIALLTAACASSEESPSSAVEPSETTAATDIEAATPDVQEDTASVVSLETAPLPESGPAGEVVAVALTVRAGTSAMAGATVTVEVLAGGGSAEAATTDDNGLATLAWHLGVAPVPQRLKLSVGEVSTEVSLDATRKTPLASTTFGDVPGFLEEANLDGSTEDLVFVDDTGRQVR